MKRDVRDIRKQFRLTDEEEKQILALMREQGDTNFSDFLRKSLLSSDLQKQIEIWFTLWQSQKLEQISRDVHEILISIQSERQVTQEHVSILLTCVQELIKEVGNSIPPQSRLPRQIYEVDTWNIVTESISRKCFCLILS